MAPNARPTAAKRKATAGPKADGIDPDIADIKLGPQPLADWQIEDTEG